MTDSQAMTTIATSPPIIVYWLNRSRADRIVFLLEELGLPYELERSDRGSDQFAPARLKKIHPLGKSPMIQDGERVVAESGAIIEYLIDKYGQGKHLKPKHEEDLLQYTYFLHYIEGSLMPFVVMKYIFLNIQRQAPWIVRPIVNGLCTKINETYLGPNIRTHLQFLEGELGKRKWLAGKHFSGADIQANFAFEGLIQLSGAPADEIPNLTRYINAMHDRPAYKRAMDRIEKSSSAAKHKSTCVLP